MMCVSVRTMYSFFFRNIPALVCASPCSSTVRVGVRPRPSIPPSPKPSEDALVGVEDSGSPDASPDNSSLLDRTEDFNEPKPEVGARLTVDLKLNDGLRDLGESDTAEADLISSPSRATSGWFTSVNRLGARRCGCFFNVFLESSFELVELKVGRANKLFLRPHEESLLLLDIVCCCRSAPRDAEIDRP